MPMITFQNTDGVDEIVEALPGSTLMEAGVQAGVEFIIGECAGACACATCHGWIDDAWLDKVGTPNNMESEMLEDLDTRGPTSRLLCQIKVTNDLNGLVIYEPRLKA